MLDMYLFINPLGSACYHTEQNILKLGDSLNEKINFNFVPLMNFKTINDVMCRMNIPLNNVDIRNRLSENIYHSSIDFKAASFQGKKKGRNFLLNVQQLVVNDQKDYNFETIKLAAQKSGLDWDIVEQDRHSKLAIEALQKGVLNESDKKTVYLGATEYTLYSDEFYVSESDKIVLTSIVDDMLANEISINDAIKSIKNKLK